MKSSVRSLFLKIHIYAGLLCSSYLLIFGLSSLNYNPHFGKPTDDADATSWERRIELTNVDGNDRAFSGAISDSLGLIGWTIPWETYRDDDRNLHFGLNRPGKKYTIHAFFDDGRVRVEERRTGFWSVINSLHALMRLPYSPFMDPWGAYTELCTWVVLFSAGTGVYFWARRRSERLVGWVLLATGSGTSLLFMLYVWWRG